MVNPATESKKHAVFGQAQPIPFESQSDRRRAQLVRAAANLIAAGGLESATMGAVAELAGCTRVLVHQYFRRREDLLHAVVAEFYKTLESRLSEIESLLDQGEPANLGRFMNAALERGWDVIEEGGLAGLIIVTATHGDSEASKLIEEVRRPIMDRFANIFSGMLPKDDALMLMELNVAAAYRLAVKRGRGEITRDDAVAQWQHYTRLLVRGFLNFDVVETSSQATP